MSNDRFVRFPKGAPSREEVLTVLEDFLGGVGTAEWRDHRYYITLPGRCARSDNPGPRGFEVVVREEFLNTITRRADEFTTALADRIHRRFVYEWAGVEDV